jgi:hypothetical protein
MINHMMISYILAGCNPSCLLAMGFWNGVTDKNFKLFWHERFTCIFPQRLVDIVAPQLRELDEKHKALGTSCPPSFASFVSLLHYLAIVVLQVGGCSAAANSVVICRIGIWWGPTPPAPRPHPPRTRWSLLRSTQRTRSTRCSSRTPSL